MLSSSMLRAPMLGAPLSSWFDSFWSEPLRATSWIQTERTERGVRVTAELAGFEPKDVTVDHVDGVLEIRAERGEKRRSAIVTVGHGDARAAMEHGVLVIDVTRESERERVEIGASIDALNAASSAEPAGEVSPEAVSEASTDTAAE